FQWLVAQERDLELIELRSDVDVEGGHSQSSLSGSECESEVESQSDHYELSRVIESFENDDVSVDPHSIQVHVEEQDSPCPESPHAKGVALNNELKDFFIEMNVSHSVIKGILKIFKPYHPFLPMDPRTLLGTTRDNCPIEEMGGGEFMYLGVEERIVKFLTPRLTAINFSCLTISVSIDGDSPLKCTKDQLWPISIRIEELPRSKPILVAAWFGRGHPPVGPYLDKFVKELKVLLEQGISINPDKSFEVRLKNFICDAPATAMIKMTKYHSGFYGCGKCFGEKVEGCLVFLDTDAQLRTDQNFRQQLQPEHHKEKSPLLNLPIDSIAAFPLDYLHLILIGALKRYIDVLKDGYVVADGQPRFEIVNGNMVKKKKKRKGKLSQNVVNAINKAIEKLRIFCPSEFSRMCRSFTDSAIWKATECRQFLLYIGVLVLKGLISKEQYNLFLKLHVATRIVCSKSLCLKFGRIAGDLMTSFVKDSPKVCGKSFPTYCVHNLCHIYDDVQRQEQPLDCFSAFPYESFHCTLKNLLRGRAKPLAQLYKRMQEKEDEAVDEEVVDSAVSYSHEGGPTCGLEGLQYQQLIRDSFKFSTRNVKDSYIVMKDGTVVKALNFIKKDKKISVVGKCFTRYQDLYSKPIKSSLLGISVVSGFSSHILHWSLEDIKAKAYVMPLNSRTVSVELLHSS
ncbi:LOW QUALITY PROTEIN: Aspartate--tRNA(Asp/Asn) ligase, partial [Frankliniella fusca]